jgi:hypothetical protein
MLEVDDPAREARRNVAEVRRFWARKWFDYLAIGNGGALLAVASASLQSKDTAKLLIPSAWWFFAGLAAAGTLPKMRFLDTSIGLRGMLRHKHKPQLHGIPASPALKTGAFVAIRLLNLISWLLEWTAVGAFGAGIWTTLTRIQ